MNYYGKTGSAGARGFTLIELMIVVTVLAIIVAVALPSYRSYALKANRSAAQQIMLNIQNREEMYMADARSYTAALNSTGLNISQDGWTCTAAKCSNSNYDVTVTVHSTTPPTYTITATAINNQVSDGNMTLTSAGARSRTAGDGKW